MSQVQKEEAANACQQTIITGHYPIFSTAINGLIQRWHIHYNTHFFITFSMQKELWVKKTWSLYFTLFSSWVHLTMNQNQSESSYCTVHLAGYQRTHCPVVGHASNDNSTTRENCNQLCISQKKKKKLKCQHGTLQNSQILENLTPYA